MKNASRSYVGFKHVLRHLAQLTRGDMLHWTSQATGLSFTGEGPWRVECPIHSECSMVVKLRPGHDDISWTCARQRSPRGLWEITFQVGRKKGYARDKKDALFTLMAWANNAGAFLTDHQERELQEWARRTGPFTIEQRVLAAVSSGLSHSRKIQKAVGAKRTRVLDALLRLEAEGKICRGGPLKSGHVGWELTGSREPVDHFSGLVPELVPEPVEGTSRAERVQEVMTHTIEKEELRSSPSARGREGSDALASSPSRTYRFFVREVAGRKQVLIPSPSGELVWRDSQYLVYAPRLPGTASPESNLAAS